MAADENNDVNPSNDFNPDLTPDELARREQELKDYRIALEQELRANVEQKPDDAILDVLDFFKKKMPEAAAQIAYLANNSTSDSTRLSANKYMIEVVRRGYAENPTDPVANILATLMNGSETADAIKAENTKID